jgi:hypothetical protein
MNMLDIIEQECERQLSMNSTAVSTPEETIAVAVINVESAERSDASTANNYNWLTYKENNIELLEVHNNSTYEYLQEERQTKVDRYLFKRTLRNWGKKISYVCRK